MAKQVSDMIAVFGSGEEARKRIEHYVLTSAELIYLEGKTDGAIHLSKKLGKLSARQKILYCQRCDFL